MNVRELMEKLSKLDPELTVVVTSSNFEQNHAKKVAGGVMTFKGKIATETFRDAFDYETYESEVVRWEPGEDNHNCVEITEY